MDYMTHRSDRKEEHNFGVTCPDTLFVEFAPVPPKHEKLLVDVSGPRRTKIHYVTRTSHGMQKHKFDVTCLGALFMETAPSPLEHKK
jgi:hypothetical protein